ncbi:MAG: class GN sortase [Hahellaceae bacterium]|nr:class GN sortase [Hahellaceae bacterium]MCP5210273.1 class GN sortase [Hahellaceae bacterium]
MRRKSKNRKSKKTMRWLAMGIMTLAALSFSNGLYIQAKAEVAQWLLQDAWVRTLAGEAQAKPWSWADIWPVASLHYRKQPTSTELFSEELFSDDHDLLVLNEASGQGLAFGPGRLASNIQPGEPGWLIIGGHRDTHFGFLERVTQGDTIALQSTDSRWHLYEVDHIQVVDSTNEMLPAPDEISEPGLILVTCYPFDVVSNGSLRYVVMAKKVQPHDNGRVITL